MVTIHNQNALNLYNKPVNTHGKIRKTIEELYYDPQTNQFFLDSLKSTDFTNGRLRGPHHFTINGVKIIVKDQSKIVDIVNEINNKRVLTGVTADNSAGRLKLIGLYKFFPIRIKHRKAAVYEIYGIDDRINFPSYAGEFLIKGVSADGTIKSSYCKIDLSQALCRTLTRIEYYISLSTELRVEVDGAGTECATLRFVNRAILNHETPGGIDIRNGIGNGLYYLGGIEGLYKEEIINTTFQIL